jgi:folate-binding protein YgfZ
MGQCLAAELVDRGVIEVAGAEARRLLQGLVTNDIETARDGRAIFAGLLTPQGKILFDFFLVPKGDGFLVEAPKASLGELLKRLNFYRLRAAVEIKEAPLKGVACWGGEPKVVEGAIAFVDPRAPELGTRVLAPQELSLDKIGCGSARENDYHAMRIAQGVPEGGRDYQYGDAFPHEALFDQLHGVDFKKGCFVGQEVVARMEHRGTARKRLIPVEGDRQLPAIGSDVLAGDTVVGSLTSIDGRLGLASLRLDRVEQAYEAGETLRAGEATLSLRRPGWLTLALPSPRVTA